VQLQARHEARADTAKRVPLVNVPITLQVPSLALYPPRPIDPGLHLRGGRLLRGSGAAEPPSRGARRRLGAA
jgi:hypothetical protein